MTTYFDLRTGALLSDTEDEGKHRWDIENRLSNRYPLYPVEGRVLEIVEKGREAANIDDNELGAVGSVHERPEAQESPEEAEKAVEEEAEERRKATLANDAVGGGFTADNDSEDEAPARGGSSKGKSSSSRRGSPSAKG